jgi:enoyl-CoA hydratase/carnithine racemase
MMDLFDHYDNIGKEDEMSTKVLYEASGGIGWITMNDPDRRNALSEELVGGLISVIKAADADGGVRVMVLTGTGTSFSAGGDLAAFAESARKSAPQHHEEGEIHTELFRLGATVHKPIIAAVNGHALGGGCGLVAMCHIALAAEEAKLGTTEIKVGLVPLVILPWIRRTVGYKNALRMMLTGDVMNAEEAKEIGLVQMVVQAERLRAEAEALARKLAGFSPLAVRLGLDAMYTTEEMDLMKSLNYLNTLRVVSFLSEDLQEGACAFLEKRQPQFTGR